jgi:hypothetical protein
MDRRVQQQRARSYSKGARSHSAGVYVRIYYGSSSEAQKEAYRGQTPTA